MKRTAVWAGVLVAVLATMALAGCGKDEFEDRTAVVDVGGHSETYQLDDCGLDGQTVFLVGRAPSGSILQAAMTLKSDDATGIAESTGASIDLQDSATSSYAAFGEEAWARREETGEPPGRISSARLKGSRIQIKGEAEQMAKAAGEVLLLPFSIDARCDQLDE